MKILLKASGLVPFPALMASAGLDLNKELDPGERGLLSVDHCTLFYFCSSIGINRGSGGPKGKEWLVGLWSC